MRGGTWLNVDVMAPEELGDALDEDMAYKRMDLDEHPWPFEDDRFELVLMDNVLEHLWNQVGTVTEVHRVLEPGGRFVVKVPHHENDKAAHLLDHKHLYSPETFRRLGKEGYGGPDVEFEIESLEVVHKHPFCWHQRTYLGRELIGWGPHRIDAVLVKPS